ncbi:hypothetical protein BG015_009298 [Linnemannia schmuckeri]|uniref:Uncharacterized protein n=1 Tax=Linnemannia schmuckeri TaxID=64567 RepID=A0A9P5RXV5_9FUNG|nr:hypothetical protein BG015_009298 [Linnemannia schmuckeri]
MPMPVVSASSHQGPIKHGHSLSSATTISYPHPSIHPPLRLLTTATCIAACTSLISAQSPPHSPTFAPFAVPESSGSAGSSSSRANSILDGIQNALGGALAASSPPNSTASTRTSSSYSAAKESLADFSIAASSSKRSQSVPATTGDSKLESSGGVIRSRSNYVSFPNFDEVDFVDVAMVDDNEEDDEDEDDHPGWAGPDSPPEGQRGALDEKTMRSAMSALDGRTDPRIGLGMPTSPSQHWLLQLETYQALQVNGV